MMTSMTFPMFAPTGGCSTTADATIASLGWSLLEDSAGTQQSNDQMDFDMLAECLLDDLPGMTNTGATLFEGFKPDATFGSGVVSPEQSEDGGQPPIADLSQQMLNHQHLQPGAAAPLVAPPAAAPNMQQQVQVMDMSHIVHMPSVQTVQMQSANANTVSQSTSFDPSVAGVTVDSHGNLKRRRVEPSLPVMDDLNQLLTVTAGGGRRRPKSQEQVDRRRERNRILARRTRLRKKFFFESLQKEIMDLQQENAKLKQLVQAHVPSPVATPLLQACTAAENLPDDVREACGGGAKGVDTDMDPQDFNLVKSIQQSQNSFVITDPSLQDNPIVYISDGFLSLIGYQREQVLGRNCRFLQGPNSNPDKVAMLKKAISNGEDVTVTMINYTADGTPFWNKLFVAALRDSQNAIVNFIGVAVKVARPEPGDPEHHMELPQPLHLNGGNAPALEEAAAAAQTLEAAFPS